jgi:hypothetical protein
VDADVVRPPSPPDGWYPDPTGAPQWRRWDAGQWGASTVPYGPPPPDAWMRNEERGAWRLLRAVAPFGLVAPAFGAAAFAADSVTFGPVRRWLREDLSATSHSRPVPPMPSLGGSPSSAVSVTLLAVWLASILGVGAWLRFTIASTRVAGGARYPLRHRARWTCLAFFIPFVGPVVSWSASCEWLPAGHEARRALGTGWALVAAGEVAILVLWVVAYASSSLAAAWGAAAVCAACWAAAAVVLPRGFEAIADDHASLGVRAALPRS